MAPPPLAVPPANPPSAISRFEIIKEIGKGTYGTVLLGRDTAIPPVSPVPPGYPPQEPDEGIVALKRMRLDAHDEGVTVTTLREVALLHDLKHENIVRLREVIIEQPRLYLIFDHMDYDLKQCLSKHPEFKEGMPIPLIRSVMVQILSGLDFCHKRLVLHRDLKPQNVLIDTRGKVKLADFGLARAFQTRRVYTQEVVTLWYRAPELLLGQNEYSAMVDLWSTGCILAEIANGRPLLPGDSEIDQIFRIFRLLGTPENASWPGVESLPDFQPIFPKWRRQPFSMALPDVPADVANLLQELIVYQPSKRLNAEAALSHAFFDPMRTAGEFVHSKICAPLETYSSAAASSAAPPAASSAGEVKAAPPGMDEAALNVHVAAEADPAAGAPAAEPAAPAPALAAPPQAAPLPSRTESFAAAAAIDPELLLPLPPLQPPPAADAGEGRGEKHLRADPRTEGASSSQPNRDNKRFKVD